MNAFAIGMRAKGAWIVHCPSDTVDTYYADYSQRTAIKAYAYTDPPVSEMPREFLSPLETYKTNGCPDKPQCTYHNHLIKQHDAIEIQARDLISDSGQEIQNFLRREEIEQVLLVGTALNMCLLGRPFGIIGMKEIGTPVKVVADLVDIAYSPAEAPYKTHEEALRLMLTHVAFKWCPVITSQSLRSVT